MPRLEVLLGDDDEILLGPDDDEILLGDSMVDDSQRIVVPAAERRVVITVNEARRIFVPAAERRLAIVAVERRAAAPTGP